MTTGHGLKTAIRILLDPKLILALFVAFKIGQTVNAFLTGEKPVFFPYIRLAEIAFLVPFSWLAVKRRTGALFLVGLVLFLQIFPAFWAILYISFKEYLLKTVAILLSGYFVYGGHTLLRQAWDNLAIPEGKSGAIPFQAGTARIRVGER
ncbi:MAG: hypothetical protein R2940_14735 [Syntrophotaleaceae bacterium]